MEPLIEGYVAYDVAPSREPTAPADKLTALVAAGDISGVRAAFDAAFWAGKPERPGWTQLKAALLREDRPMLRLLNTWGAAAGENDLAAFKTEAGAKYPLYVQFMKAAGLRPPETTSENTSESAPEPVATPRPAPPKPPPVRAVPRYSYDPEPDSGSSSTSYSSGGGSAYSGGGYGGAC